MAPPLKEVDEELLQGLAQAQLTDIEIAKLAKISVDTLTRRYAESLKEWRSEGVARIRRELYTTALSGEKGKIAAIIFFLKNFGGMSDFHHHEHQELTDIRAPLPNEFNRPTGTDRPN